MAESEKTKLSELNIYQRINWVRSQVFYVKKDQKVQDYMGITHDAVTAALHDKLVEAGIIIFPDIAESKISDAGTTSKGNTIIRYEAHYVVWFINVDKPEDRLHMNVEAHANDYGDKAPGKACSYAQKTAMLKMFMMETGLNDEGRIDSMQAELKPRITDEQALAIEAMLYDNDIPHDKFMAWLLRSIKADSISDIAADAYDAVVRQINASIKAKQK